MKGRLITISISILLGAWIISPGNKPILNSKSKNASGSNSHFAVLELFTSEGCSSCPPADNLLPELAKRYPNTIPLSFHVDYWNHLGWDDPFSSSVYSDRQREYASHLQLESVYTPQLIVNGEFEMVGSDRSNAEAAIEKALAEHDETELTISDVKSSNNKVEFKVSIKGEVKKLELLAALVQKKATMKIKAGENNGATLSHINVVRSFSMHAAKSENEIELSIPENLQADNWQLICYTRQKTEFRITGVATYNPH